MSKSLEDNLGTKIVSKLMLGSHLIVEGRALIPVVEVLTMVLPKRQAGWLAASPRAVVVIERDSEMVLPITDESVSLTQLLHDLPDLAPRIEHIRDRITT